MATTQPAPDPGSTWRSAWTEYLDAETDYRTLESNTLNAIHIDWPQARDRATDARDFIDTYGGPLDDIDPQFASTLLVAAWMDHVELNNHPYPQWRAHLQDLYDECVAVLGPETVVTPDGTRLDQLNMNGFDGQHPAPLIATAVREANLTVKETTYSLIDHARRWVTATAAPIFRDEAAVKESAEWYITHLKQTDPLTLIRSGAAAAVIKAHQTAVSAGVGIHPEQRARIKWLRDTIDHQADKLVADLNAQAVDTPVHHTNIIDPSRLHPAIDLQDPDLTIQGYPRSQIPLIDGTTITPSYDGTWSREYLPTPTIITHQTDPPDLHSYDLSL